MFSVFNTKYLCNDAGISVKRHAYHSLFVGANKNVLTHWHDIISVDYGVAHGRSSSSDTKVFNLNAASHSIPIVLLRENQLALALVVKRLDKSIFTTEAQEKLTVMGIWPNAFLS